MGLGAVDAVLIVDEDPMEGPSAREELSAALRALLAVPMCARAAATREGGLGDGGGIVEGRGGGVQGERVVTVVRFLMERTLEEAVGGAGIGSLEVSRRCRGSMFFFFFLPIFANFCHICFLRCGVGSLIKRQEMVVGRFLFVYCYVFFNNKQTAIEWRPSVCRLQGHICLCVCVA